ncbi:MAG TPA: hypothetical protein VFR47_05340 [Anaerolineales bacterium]|nr:hypothetical protein [Anaerolineales bacterium]
MTLTSKPLAVILLVFVFGGIAFSSVMGWWATESSKVPVAFTEGEFAGQANPADIRGSYTFGDIAKSFDVTPEVLAQAFGVAADDPSAFAVKELEAMYLDSGFEIGTASVRLFVAFYAGLPFNTTEQEIYLPQAATDILLANGNLTPEQIAYLQQFTVTTGISLPVEQPLAESTPVPVATHVPTSEEYTVKGKTIFGELIAWGVPQNVIEQLIGGPMPDSAMSVKDYASANGLNFETLKPALQTEVDKVRP